MSPVTHRSIPALTAQKHHMYNRVPYTIEKTTSFRRTPSTGCRVCTNVMRSTLYARSQQGRLNLNGKEDSFWPSPPWSPKKWWRPHRAGGWETLRANATTKWCCHWNVNNENHQKLKYKFKARHTSLNGRFRRTPFTAEENRRAIIQMTHNVKHVE